MDPGLGNGGLGRLAACFLDSLATLRISGDRLRHPLRLRHLHADRSTRTARSAKSRAPGCVCTTSGRSPRDDARYVVRFGGRCVDHARRAGQHALRAGSRRRTSGPSAYDQLIPGNRSPTVNHLRLWSGRAIAPFHIEAFNAGQLRRRGRRAGRREEPLARAVPGRLDAAGQGAALQAAVLLRQREPAGHPRARISPKAARSRTLPDAIAIQLNDTHPALAIPELMRLLVDEYEHASGSRAWAITRRVFCATRITRCCPRRSRPGRSRFFERLLPRHLQIIYQINAAFLDECRARVSEGRRAAPAACRSSTRTTAGACAWRTSRSSAVTRVNGVAKLHSRADAEDDLRATSPSCARTASPT